MKKTLITSLLALGLAAGAHAQTVDADNYARVSADGVSDRKFDQDSHVGFYNTTESSTAFNFLLPDLGGNDVDTVQFETFFDGYGSDGNNFDLSLFVKIEGSSTLTADDFIAPAENSFTTTPNGWTEIQLDFLQADSSLSRYDSITLSSSGQSALVSFLNDYYDSASSGGDYLVAGLAAERNGTTDVEWDAIKLRGENDDATPTVTNLSITAIPEPSSFALLAGALGLGWVMLRRRRA